jgi:hypothetical protein
MTPAAIHTALEALRKNARALRERSAARTLESLAALLETWRAADSSPRLELERRLPEATGFSAEMVRAGLAHALEPLSGDALARLVESELGGVDALDGRGPVLAEGFETTAVVLAGALPTPTLMALLAPLAMRSGVLAKVSSHDPVTARCLRASLEGIDPALAGCLEIAAFPGADEQRMEALLEADCVMASGSDATIAALAPRVRPPRRAVLRGHRLSLAVVGPLLGGVDEVEACADALALDVALWDQLGCLSPVAVLVTSADQADSLAEALAAALEQAEARWPLGRVPAAAAARIAQEREEVEFRAAAGRSVRLLAGVRWSVVREDAPRHRPSPLHRFIRVHPCGEASGILDALRPLGPHLAGVALSGFGRDQEDLAARIGRIGASRICPPGRLQAPPLCWHQDGQGVLLPLARLSDLELLPD